MITPGEEALLILLAATTILLFNFSILSTISTIQQETHQKAVFLRADKAADRLTDGAPSEGGPPLNMSIQIDGMHHGAEEGVRYLEAKRFFYSNGRLVQARVRAW